MVLFNGLLTIKGCGFLEKRGGIAPRHASTSSARDAWCEGFRMEG